MLIEDAALRLFADQGYEATTVEQIAAEVEISATTFFRYYPNKSDVILCHQDAHMPDLREVILAYPPGESDLAAVRHGIFEVWVPNADPEHSRRAGLAAAGSASLRGLYNDMSRTWLEGIAAALAQRRGLTAPDDQALITARVSLGVFNEAVRSWGVGEYSECLGTFVEQGFATLRQLAAEWAK
ncbi:transcriptional regulator, TetR family [Novosphingobium sp. CF614]|uniref:TetR family transcriptional regulator n=1 Tax=Novosphingobium sp. CF614 TaxID=1884364 RepID=UPI0008E339F2|nr:TetR family transcriptional regulator [Novosphingobium sp. CF614]SFG53913.1 transcriptional regulator, TetR family [Novosphingobium sp. CF614]